MGRPIKKQLYLGTIGTTNVAVPHQIQANVWTSFDSTGTAGYLTAQNSTTRFRATSINGNTSVCTLVNAAPTTTGQVTVKVFPISGDPTVAATANATVGTVGNANVVVGGTGYNVGDAITAVGGTFGTAAAYTVTANTGNGVIVSLSTPTVSTATQKYSVLPANIAGITTTTNSANGVGAIISSNFGLSTSYILTGGAGYGGTADVIFYTGRADFVTPTVTAPTITSGVVATGALSVTGTGVLNAIPTITVEGLTGTTEYVKDLTSQNYLFTFQGNQYKWLPKGATVPADYATVNPPIAYLDTL